MNHILPDNKVSSLVTYADSRLGHLYEERERKNIITELFRKIMNWSRADLALRRDDLISESEMLRLHFAIKRLHAGEPMQYVFGETWFYGMAFSVNSAVLIPRPETEELVKYVIDHCHYYDPRIVDIGTGSGCIAISLKKHKTEAEVVAIDVSHAALEVARTNARQLEADVQFVEQDILEKGLDGMWDVIVSNPPYIPQSESASMRSSVVNHEPSLALFVPNGEAMLFYNRLLDLCLIHLKRDGMGCFELHEDFSKEFSELAVQKGFTAEVYKDMQGKPRMGIVKRS